MATSTHNFRIETTDMHTAGEPVRIVEAGYPEVRGSTLLEKRRYAQESLDHLRRLLMLEPRGHAGMYGVILVPPDHPEAHLAALFTHHEGYSTMCGHATLALARYAVEKGLVSPLTPPETTVNVQCPCGLVQAHVRHCEDGRTAGVRFQSVPSFAFALGVKVEVAAPLERTVEVDIGYGGAFYALVTASALGLDIHESPTKKIVELASAVSDAVRKQVVLRHPDGEPDLNFLYGSIVTDGQDEHSEQPTTNVCVFADGQVDRSPTGSGVSARAAVQFARGQLAVGQSRTFRSCIGTTFTGKVVRETACGDLSAVVVEVAGEAYYIGNSQFMLEADDPLPTGFTLR